MTIVETILEQVNQIPPLSNASSKVMTLIGKDDVSAGSISEIVSHDASLAAQILRVSNSAAYKRREKIESIQLAISLLGNRTVLGVVMGYCMSGVYGKQLAGYDAPRGALWKNSVASAIAAQLLSQHARSPVSMELAYTAGLLHDIGKSVLSEYMKNSIQEMITKLDHSDEKDFLKAEEDVVGTNHCVVGEAMARKWSLPDSLCEAIAFHHAPSEASDEYKTLVYLVHLADMISMIQGIDTGVDSMMYMVDQNYQNYIHFSSPKELEKIIMLVESEYVKLTESFNPS